MVKRYRKKDPKRKDEAKRYEHPVPSREYILQYLNEVGAPVELPHLLQALGLSKEPEVDGFIHRLKAMLRDGQLHKNRKGCFAPSKKLHLVAGVVAGHPEGYGFVTPDEGGDDVYISEREMRSLLSGDRVLLRLSKSRSRRRSEGRVVEVLQRNTSELVGRFYLQHGHAFVQPDDRTMPQRIMIDNNEIDGAHPEDYVVVKILQQPTSRNLATGQITQVLGNSLTPGLEIDLSVRNNHIPAVWPQTVLEESEDFSAHVEDADLAAREDLRHLPFVTIDGEDAKDFDDAVYCEPLGKRWRLYVAIADVAHYVQAGSALDLEAKSRGNSVYFPGRVVPMLPEVLSNGLCSLKPNVDRLAMVAVLDVTADGRLQRTRLHNAVIQSHARLTYTEVAAMLQNQSNNSVLADVNNLNQLFKILLLCREQRGALDFDTTETRIIFNSAGKIAKIVPSVRNDAHRIIEECMLLANVAVAQFLEKSKIPALYRVHASPDKLKIKQLRDFLKLFAIQLPGGKEPSSLDFSSVLKQVKGREDFHLLQTTVLRTLQQAVYSAENQGHFGLAYEGYTQFTSPIRRYPDLMVHRALKSLLAKEKRSQFPYNVERIGEIALHCSMTERRADLATREAVDRLKCDFMQDKVGKVFSGTVVDVTNFGLFVELDDVYVQGLVHVTALHNDYYQYNELKRVLLGEKSGVAYRLGDKIKVLVSRVDADRRFIDFDLA